MICIPKSLSAVLFRPISHNNTVTMETSSTHAQLHIPCRAGWHGCRGGSRKLGAGGGGGGGHSKGVAGGGAKQAGGGAAPGRVREGGTSRQGCRKSGRGPACDPPA